MTGHADNHKLAVAPIVSWPREVVPGRTYLVTVDLQVVGADTWPSGREEFTLTCWLDGAAAFTTEPLDDPRLVLHRFGGTYGPIRFLIGVRNGVASRVDVPGVLELNFITDSGERIDPTEIECRILATDPDRPIQDGQVVSPTAVPIGTLVPVSDPPSAIRSREVADPGRLSPMILARADDMSRAARESLVSVAALSILDLKVRRDDLPSGAVAELGRLPLVELTDGTIGLSQQALAAPLLRHAKWHWESGAGRQAPAGTVVAAHLLRADPEWTQTALDKLERAAPHRTSDGSASRRWPASLWRGLRSLGRELAAAVDQDPTWGGDVAAAAAAASALHALRRDAVADQAAAFVRAMWAVRGNPPSLVYQGPQPRPGADGFDDLGVAEASTRGRGPARTVYDLWILPGLIEMEASAPTPDRDRIGALAATMLGWQEPDGRFGPWRVQWLTAHAIAGLCLASAFVDLARPLDSACAWLRAQKPTTYAQTLTGWTAVSAAPERRRQEKGEAAARSTRPRLAATADIALALCITALLRNGFTADDANVVAGCGELWSRRAVWTAPGQERVETVVAEALALADFEIVDTYSYSRNALFWAAEGLRELTTEWWWGGDQTPTDTHGHEPRDLPFASVRLISLVSTVLRRELSSFLDDEAGLTETAEGDPVAAAASLKQSSVVDFGTNTVERALRPRFTPEPVRHERVTELPPSEDAHHDTESLAPTEDIRMSDEDLDLLLSTVATVYHDQGSMEAVLRLLRVPRAMIPVMDNATSTWTQIFSLFDNGIIATPYRRLLQAALRVYSANPDLLDLQQRYLRTPQPRENATVDIDHAAQPKTPCHVIVRASNEDEREQSERILRDLGLAPQPVWSTAHALSFSVSTDNANAVRRLLDRTTLGWTVVPPGQNDYLLSRLYVEGPDGRYFSITDAPAQQTLANIAGEVVSQYPALTGNTRPTVVELLQPDGRGLRRVNPGETLHDIGVRDGDQLRVGFQATAG